MNEAHRKSFLDKFADEYHNVITQWFCYAIRDGNQTIADIISAVEDRAIERLNYNQKEYDTWRSFLDLLDTQEAKDFANYIFWRESLPKEDRLKLKYANARTYQEKHMASQPPSEKQLKYLEGLGVVEVPTTKLRASELIDAAVKAKQ